MPNSVMVEAIHRFLEAVTGVPLLEQERLPTLAEALDRLALAYHHIPEGAPGSDADPPRESDAALREEISRRFPELGLYASVPPEEPSGAALDCAPEVGDAVDDLTDVVGEMRAIVWRCKNVDEEDAAWHFRFGYRTHWGRHLHDLRRYLHLLMFEN